MNTRTLLEDSLKAIRNDERIGNGTCSMIDECMDDEEIIEDLEKASVTTVKEALKVAYMWEGIYEEKKANVDSQCDNFKYSSWNN